MKVLANETKRILAVLLSVAMIFAYVPNNVMAYADEVSGNDTEEAAETVDEEVVTDDSADALNDVAVWINNNTGEGDNAIIGSSKYYTLYDLTTVENTGAKGTGFANDTKKTDPTAINGFNGHRERADHKNTYTFIVEPNAGYKLKGNIISGLEYDKFTSDTESAVETISSKDGNWVIEDYNGDLYNINKGSKKVTITAEALKKAYDGGRVTSDGAIKGRELTVKFESTVTEVATLTVPLTCYDNTVELKPVVDADFEMELDADGEVDLADYVINFADYSVGQTGDFLSVEVYDKDGNVVPGYTQKNLDNGTAADNNKILDLKNSSATTDYTTRCTAFGTPLAISDLATAHWVAYASADGDYTYTSPLPANPDLTAGTVIIARAALKAIYSAGYSAKIVVSAANSGSVGRYAVTYLDAGDEFVKYTAVGVPGTKAPENVGTSANLSFDVLPVVTSSASRQVDRIWYSVGDGDEVASDDASSGASRSGDTFTIPNAEITDDVYVRADASEKTTLSVTGATTNLSDIIVLTPEGTALAADSLIDPAKRAIDGKPFNFIVIAKNGKKISDVQTSIGSGSLNSKSFNNGYYSTEDDVNGTVAISVTTATRSETSYDVKLTDTTTATVETAEGAAISTTAINKAEGGKPFYFTVRKAALADTIDSVFVQVGDGTSHEVKPIAEDKSLGKYWYVVTGDTTPAINGKVDITVNASSSAGSKVASVYAISNDKAEFRFNGVVAKAGSSVKAGKGTNFSVQIDPADSATTKITEIGWIEGSSLTGVVADYTGAGATAKHKEGEAAGSFNFTIPTGAGDSVVVYALTEETVPATDYKFNFVDSSATSRVVSTYDPVDKKDVNHLTNQSLDTVLNESAPSNLANTEVHLYNKTARSYNSYMKTTYGSQTGEVNVTSRTPKLEFELADKTSNVVVVNSTNKTTITPHEKGTVLLNAKFVLDDDKPTGSARGPLNRLVYTASLEANVKGLYTDLTIASSTDAFYPWVNGTSNDKATLWISGKDGQTGKPVNITGTSAGIKQIHWIFEPDIEKIPVADRSYGLYDGTTYYLSELDDKSTDTKTAYVTARKETTPFQVKAVVTYTDGTEDKNIPVKTLQCIEKPADDNFFYVTKTSGAVVTDDYTTATTINLGLADNDAKSVTVEYDVYQVLDVTGFETLVGTGVYDHESTPAFQHGITKEKVAEAIKKGYIQKAENAVVVSPGITLRNAGGTKQDVKIADYATFTEGINTFSITGIKKTPTTPSTYYIQLEKPEISVDGVVRKDLNTTTAATDGQVKIQIVDRANKQKVDLVLYDDIEKTVGTEKTHTIIEQKLKDEYIASRPYSEVESRDPKNKAGVLNSAWTYGKLTGGEFLSVPRNSSFVLPTAEDFATSPSANRVLVGWQEYTGTLDDGVAPVANAAAVYKKPGDSVSIAASDVVYKAVWADKYGISDITNGNIVTIGQDDYDETIKNAKKYDSPLSDIIVGGCVPVVLKVSEAYSIKTAPVTTGNKDATKQIESKSKYVTTGFTLASKYANTASAITLGTDKDNRPTVSGNMLATSSKVGVTATWASDAGNITKESNDFKVIEGGKFKLDLDKTTIAVEEGQDPVSAVVKTTLTVDNAGADYKIDDSTDWGTAGDGSYKDPDRYSLVWSNSSNTDAEYATAQTLFDKDSTQPAGKIVNYIAGLKATTQPVTLTLTATNALGQKATKTIAVTVNSPKVSFKLYNNDLTKSEITGDKFEAFANSTHYKGATIPANEYNSFLVKAFDETGKDITNDGTWAIDVPLGADTLNKVIDKNTGTATSAGQLRTLANNAGYKVAQLDTRDVVDEDKITIKYTVNGVTYCKNVDISTCYAIELKSSKGSKINTYITNNGTKVVDKDGKPVNAYIKVGVDKKVKGEGSNFSFNNISLAGYSAVYENTDTDPDTKTFDHWNKGIYDYTTEIETLKKTNFNGGIYTLTPVMTPELTVTGIPGTVTLTHDTPTEVKTTKQYDVEVSPKASTPVQIYARSEDIGFFTVNGGASGNDPITFTGETKDKKAKTATLTLAKEGVNKNDWRAGKTTINYYATIDSSKVLATTTLYVDGIDYDDETEIRSYYEKGEKVKSTMRTVYDSVTKTTTTYYFDENGAQITKAGVYNIDDKKVLLLAGGNVADKGVQVFDNNEYFVEGDAGEIAVAKLVTVKDKDGKDLQRYASEDGILVTYAMTVAKGTPGKWSDKGGAYLIEEGTNAAKADHTEHTWTYKSMDWTGYNFQTASGNAIAVFVCEKGQETGTAPAEVKAESKTVQPAEPELAYTVWKFTATATVNPDGKNITAQKEIVYKQFKGGAWMDATEKDWKAAGGSGESGESKNPGQTESEPAQSETPTYQSFNLFYKDQRTIPVPGLSDALGDAKTLSGKAGEYFDVDGDSVKVKDSLDYKKIKKAVNASNSLIKEGSFTYQLPVYYQKPSLKLTSAKGTRKKGDSAVVFFKTQITEKKSSGNYEPIALDASAITADSKLSAALAVPDGADSAISTDETTVSIATKQKGSGKLLVQALDDDKKPAWAEPIKLSYSVAESSKDIIVVSSKKINMNAKATGENLEGEKVTVTFNGQEEFEGVKADLTKLPSTSGVSVKGIDESGNVGHELTFEYAEGGAKKGSYKVVLQGGNSAKVTITVKVADSDLSKAVSLTVRSQMDVTKKQKMVLIPKLKTVGGVINQEVKVSDTNLVAEYYADSNKIVVGPAEDDWSKLSANNNYQATFTVNVSGIECPVGIKTKILAKTPTVKMGAVTFPKSSFPGTEETPLTGETNVLATYKQGGKTFSVEPDVDKDGNAMVTFVNGGTADSDGWYTDSKTNTKVKYEDGVIKVQTTAQSKKGSVKLNITFPGGAVAKNKSFKIAIDSKK